jgi:hypothetical protein
MFIDFVDTHVSRMSVTIAPQRNVIPVRAGTQRSQRNFCVSFDKLRTGFGSLWCIKIILLTASIIRTMAAHEL